MSSNRMYIHGSSGPCGQACGTVKLSLDENFVCKLRKKMAFRQYVYECVLLMRPGLIVVSDNIHIYTHQHHVLLKGAFQMISYQKNVRYTWYKNMNLIRMLNEDVSSKVDDKFRTYWTFSRLLSTISIMVRLHRR